MPPENYTQLPPLSHEEKFARTKLCILIAILFALLVLASSIYNVAEKAAQIFASYQRHSLSKVRMEGSTDGLYVWRIDSYTGKMSFCMKDQTSGEVGCYEAHEYDENLKRKN